MKSLYHIQYIESCSTKIKSFITLKARDKFLLDFLLKSQNEPDNWIDILFEGTLEWRMDDVKNN